MLKIDRTFQWNGEQIPEDHWLNQDYDIGYLRTEGSLYVIDKSANVLHIEKGDYIIKFYHVLIECTEEQFNVIMEDYNAD